MLISIIAVVLIALLVCLAVRDEKKFKEKWPPIDDDEFLRRCPAGTDRETALTVRAIVSEQLGVEYDRIYPEQNFVQDLGCD